MKKVSDFQAHPHTQAVLDAWRRLVRGELDLSSAARNADLGLVGSLFVLDRAAEGDFPFRRAGAELEQLFGRSLNDHSFLSIWNPSDRQLVSAAMDVCLTGQSPVLIRAMGATLTGRDIDLEILLAPLAGPLQPARRVLGLCQALGSRTSLGGRPLHRLHVSALYPPAPALSPAIRLVANNEN